MKHIIHFALMTILLSACKTSQEIENARKNAESFEQILETHTGQAHTVAKQKTDFIVLKNESTGEFTAYSLKGYDRTTDFSYDIYLSKGRVEGVDIIRNLSVVKEYVRKGHYEHFNKTTKMWIEGHDGSDTVRWVEENVLETFYVGGGFKFENTASLSKELETLRSLEEDAKEIMITSALTARYSLSETRAQELAKLASKYQRLESSRELTTREKDQFALKALGVSMTEVDEALIEKTQGDDSRYESLLQVAARANNTTPEQIGQFFNEMIE